MLLNPCADGLASFCLRFLNAADSCFAAAGVFRDSLLPTNAAAALAARFVSISGELAGACPPPDLAAGDVFAAGALAAAAAGFFAAVPDDAAGDFAAGDVEDDAAFFLPVA